MPLSSLLIAQALPESPASVWGRQRGGPIQVCSQKEGVWFKTDTCQSLTRFPLLCLMPQPTWTSFAERLKGSSLKQLGQIAMPASWSSKPALSSLSGRAIHRLRISFSIPLALKETLGQSPQKAQQFPLLRAGWFSVITGRQILNTFLMRLEAPAGMCLWRPSACINRYDDSFLA